MNMGEGDKERNRLTDRQGKRDKKTGTDKLRNRQREK
jgi:hypothetical protein